MPKSDIVVIGASAGGVEALRTVAAGFPADLRASVFIVLHIGTGINGQSALPAILSRSGPLASRHPVEGEAIQQGVLYVAPPDCHLLLQDGKIHLSHGPKENRTRPAINPLFRSAARNFGGRALGVILTGLLDDGVAGLAEIKRHGGVAVVEDPLTAMYPNMPENALGRVPVDYVVPLEHLPGLIAKLSSTEHIAVEKQEPVNRELIEIKCPECGGPIWEERQGSIVEYRCLVGHAYSPLAIASEHQDAVERTLWAAVVSLEEAAIVDERLAAELGPISSREAERKRESAAKIRELLNRAPEVD